MRRTSALSLALAGLASHVLAQPLPPAAATSPRQLADLTLEQLSAIEVTSVSGRAERLQDAAASVFVITAQDIRRSAATSLPEALRLAPNLQVAQTSAGQWAISARGFNDAIANKLLVLVDGRTLYSPLFAGVFWDAADLPLEDVERIEVVSGPGGTLWGANAVNGVINVVTRRAAETQGPLVAVTRSGQGGRLVARQGGRIGPDGHWRAWVLATDRDDTTVERRTTPRGDAATRRQAGWRVDWGTATDGFSLQGEAYDGGPTGSVPSNLSPGIHGGHLLGRWSGTGADGAPWRLQGAWDLTDRDDRNLFRTRAETLDLQFTREPRVRTGQLLWGAGVRQTRDRNEATALVRFDPPARTLHWANVFAQYQRLLGPQLEGTAGVKAERATDMGWELLPNLRLAWLHAREATTWAALSRVVRAPARIDRDFYLPGRPPFLIAGGPAFGPEIATVAELGHRRAFGESASVSVTLFRQQFRGLRAGVPGVSPATVQNLVEGPVDGLEAWGRWQPARGWQLSGGVLHLRQDLRFADGLAPTVTTFPGLGNDPRTQWSLRSSHDLGQGVELDLALRRVGRLPAPVVPAYTAVDLRFGVQASRDWRVALLARNLGDPGHREFLAAGSGSELGRQVLLQVTWAP
jgi:iron complex outermembrane receptor protein